MEEVIKEIFSHKFHIGRSDRNRLCNNQSFVIWLTGLSGSGKSTIANFLEQQLHAHGFLTYVLDGDDIRKGLNKDLGFTKEGRHENIRRVGELCKIMVDAGIIVIAAFISPFQKDREFLSAILQRDYVEVFLKCPVEVCEQRDTKGLYKKVRDGKLENFSGISAPYEEPEFPDLVLRTDQLKVEDCVNIIFNLVIRKVKYNK